MRKFNIAGLSFGKLKAIQIVGQSPRGALWKCVCECGAERIVTTATLNAGCAKSCGAKKCRRYYRGEHRSSKEHRTWRKMILRCHNEKDGGYYKYGARGIRVCEEWRNDFDAFYAFIGPAPSPGHTIDRINNNGSYEPGNVRWATVHEQANNRRNNRWITFNGETLTLRAWARKIGIGDSVLFGRLRRFPLSLALTAPPTKRGYDIYWNPCVPRLNVLRKREAVK